MSVKDIPQRHGRFGQGRRGKPVLPQAGAGFRRRGHRPCGGTAPWGQGLQDGPDAAAHAEPFVRGIGVGHQKQNVARVHQFHGQAGPPQRVSQGDARRIRAVELQRDLRLVQGRDAGPADHVGRGQDPQAWQARQGAAQLPRRRQGPGHHAVAVGRQLGPRRVEGAHKQVIGARRRQKAHHIGGALPVDAGAPDVQQGALGQGAQDLVRALGHHVGAALQGRRRQFLVEP